MEYGVWTVAACKRAVDRWKRRSRWWWRIPRQLERDEAALVDGERGHPERELRVHRAVEARVRRLEVERRHGRVVRHLLRHQPPVLLLAAPDMYSYIYSLRVSSCMHMEQMNGSQV